MNRRRSDSFFSGVDPVAVILYLVILVIGCVCITSASFDDSTSNIFAFSHFYVKQIIWVGVALLAALFVLLIDVSFFHRYAYILYGIGVVLLFATLLFGREVNGAKAWFEFGSFRLQPVELVKISTGLMVARVMSEYSFSINKFGDFMKVAIIMLIPLGIIVLQNDTGSGIVFGSFLFVFYREGLSKWLCIPVLVVAMLFIVSFILSPILLLTLSILACVLCDIMIGGEWVLRVRYLATLALLTIVVYLGSALVLGNSISLYAALLSSTLLSLIVVAAYAFRHKIQSTLLIIGFFLLEMAFLPTTSYIFNEILRDHQRGRILTFLGLVKDPLGTGYNVNQAKIAIGSGGLWGKGFLQGTQIKYGFVPERHTDFIFCDLAEEWGFAGALVLLGCFCALILRLMRMGERQAEGFGRVYCYCVASILLFHTLVNVGMTIGLMPVMGIPLPLVSYGGSSLLAFTTLIFIAIRLDVASTHSQSF
ncbi:MAG: rod shape-determining protein RodA [Rikenellaceae bacterium]